MVSVALARQTSRRNMILPDNTDPGLWNHVADSLTTTTTTTTTSSSSATTTSTRGATYNSIDISCQEVGDNNGERRRMKADDDNVMAEPSSIPTDFYNGKVAAAFASMLTYRIVQEGFRSYLGMDSLSAFLPLSLSISNIIILF